VSRRSLQLLHLEANYPAIPTTRSPPSAFANATTVFWIEAPVGVYACFRLLLLVDDPPFALMTPNNALRIERLRETVSGGRPWPLTGYLRYIFFERDCNRDVMRILDRLGHRQTPSTFLECCAVRGRGVAGFSPELLALFKVLNIYAYLLIKSFDACEKRG